MTGSPLLEGLDGLLGSAEELYTDVHAHPELSMREHRTAGLAADEAAAALAEAGRRLGLPAADPVRGGEGFERLLDACLA